MSPNFNFIQVGRRRAFDTHLSLSAMGLDVVPVLSRREGGIDMGVRWKCEAGWVDESIGKSLSSAAGLGAVSFLPRLRFSAALFFCVMARFFFGHRIS